MVLNIRDDKEIESDNINKLNNNKRSLKDFNNTLSESMPKAKKRKSESDIPTDNQQQPNPDNNSCSNNNSDNNNPDNNNSDNNNPYNNNSDNNNPYNNNSDNNNPDNNNPDNNILQEIKKLYTIIEKQKKKINELEKKTKAFAKRGNMLEDAVNDIYDMIDDWSEEYDINDPEYVPTIIGEFKLSDMDLDNNGNIKGIKNHNTRNKNKSTSNSNDNSKSNEEANTNVNTSSSNKKCKNTTLKTSYNNTKNQINNKQNIDIEISEKDLKKLYSKDGDKYLESLIKTAIKNNNPELYIEEYCKTNNLSSTKHKDILNDYREFNELNKKLHSNGETKISDIDAFINNKPETRKIIISSLKALNTKYETQDNYKFKILSSGMNAFVQQQALYKIKQLENTEPGTGEYYKLKNWLDTLTTIPFNKYIALDLVNNQVSGFLENSREKLDNVIYGQDETKDIIIQIIAKMISNPDKCGNVFAIYGPPGVGKTTIIKEGMSKALGIPFAFLSLGGASDSSFLEGHGYTYEGSTPGKIVDILRKVECMNPILYFDELDKVSETRKGEEISNLLIHLTDPSQNSHFQDKYLGDIDLDLSKSIFVFSFNNINKVNPILLDRMELIYVNGFNNKEKKIIARDYLIPELLETYNLYTINNENKRSKQLGRTSKNKVNITSRNNNALKVPDIDLTDDNLEFIINFNRINNIDSIPEDGVRGIKRRIEKICSNLNIIKLTKGKWSNAIHSVLDNCDELKECVFPIKLSNDTIKKILLSNINNTSSAPPIGMYM